MLLFIISTSCKTHVQDNSTKTKNLFSSYLNIIDSTLNENSGLIFWNDLLWTFNDSGGKNEIYGFSPESGKIVITVELHNVSNYDWEDITQDDQNIYVGEIGNNNGCRKDLQIFIVKKSDITNAPFQQVNVESIKYSYADQKEFHCRSKYHNFDCEALVSLNDKLIIFTKNWTDNKTRAYKMPKEPGEYILSPVDSFNTNGLVTGADINEKGVLALIGYKDYKSLAWTFDATEDNLFGNPIYYDLSTLVDAQTEGICFDNKGNILFSCERTEDYQEQVWKLYRQ